MPPDSFANFVNQPDLFLITVYDYNNLYAKFQAWKNKGYGSAKSVKFLNPQIFSQTHFPLSEISQTAIFINFMFHFSKCKIFMTGKISGLVFYFYFLNPSKNFSQTQKFLFFVTKRTD